MGDKDNDIVMQLLEQWSLAYGKGTINKRDLTADEIMEKVFPSEYIRSYWDSIGFKLSAMDIAITIFNMRTNLYDKLILLNAQKQFSDAETRKCIDECFEDVAEKIDTLVLQNHPFYPERNGLIRGYQDDVIPGRYVSFPFPFHKGDIVHNVDNDTYAVIISAPEKDESFTDFEKDMERGFGKYHIFRPYCKIWELSVDGRIWPGHVHAFRLEPVQKKSDNRCKILEQIRDYVLSKKVDLPELTQLMYEYVNEKNI